MQLQNFALAGKEIVFNVEPVHGLKMAAQHGNRNQIGDRGSFRRSVFNGVQSFQAYLQVLFVRFIPLRDLGI